MKKLYFAIIALAAFTFASCEKDQPGATAVEAMSGQWYVHLQHVDEAGELLWDGEDLFGVGNFLILTHNTADNDPKKLFINDLGNFWEFQVVANCDLASKTFSVTDGEDFLNGIQVTIKNGKILPGAATTPSGMKADSIVFEVAFSDDPYPAAGYYDHHRISGYRYTGLVNDD